MVEYKLKGIDGKKFSVYEWGDVKSKRGIMLVVSGANEYGARYESVAQYFNSKGFVVAAMDGRGLGKTAGRPKQVGILPKYEKGDVNAFEGSVNDINVLADEMKKKYKNIPLIVIGQSYGSLLVQRFIQMYPKCAEAVILSGTTKMRGFGVFALRCISYIGCLFKGVDAPAVILKQLTNNRWQCAYEQKGESWLTRDKDAVAEYVKDEYCDNTLSYRFYKNYFDGVAKIYKRKNLKRANRRLPILILGGKDDRSSKKTGKVQELKLTYMENKMFDTEIKIYNGARHELFFELNKDEVLKDIFKFATEAISKLNRIPIVVKKKVVEEQPQIVANVAVQSETVAVKENIVEAASTPVEAVIEKKEPVAKKAVAKPIEAKEKAVVEEQKSVAKKTVEKIASNDDKTVVKKDSPKKAEVKTTESAPKKAVAKKTVEKQTEEK